MSTDTTRFTDAANKLQLDNTDELPQGLLSPAIFDRLGESEKLRRIAVKKWGVRYNPQP